MKTYIFRAEVEQDPSGRWGAEVPSLPGCATEGDTKEEALEALREAAQAYLEVMHEHGDPLPEEAEQEVTIINSADVVAITV
ncbi:MAG: type II toxin-antitoxin system HicB family antitoxin [Chloroflexi bacterium]|nr:type II toxin-antitoxin system HicB family antitoxin [Chloroflexota bacterium]